MGCNLQRILKVRTLNKKNAPKFVAERQYETAQELCDLIRNC